MGIYVGQSPNHAENVALVLNPITGLVIPQYHLVFDNNFSTVPNIQKGTVPPHWADLVWHSSEHTTSEFIDLTKTWFQGQPDITAGEMIDNPSTTASKGDRSSSFEEEPLMTNEGAPSVENEGASATTTEGDSSSTQNLDHEGDANMTMPKIIDLASAGLRQFPHLQEQKSRNAMSFTSILTNFCAIGIVLAGCLKPTYALSTGQAAIESFIY